MMQVAYVENRKLVITGYRGYIGSYLCDALGEAGDDVVTVPMGEVQDVDIVIHLAARVADSVECYENNINLDLKVSSWCQTQGAYLVYMSTNNVYPFADDCNPTTQTSPNDYYEISKVHAEQLIQKQSELRYTILRLGDVFGQNQKYSNLFKAIESSIASGAALKLYGRGLKVRNYIYIRDLVNLLMYLITDADMGKCTAKVMNVAYAEPVSVYQIVSSISDEHGLDIETVDMDISKELRDYRTMRSDAWPGFSYEFNIWQALRDYAGSISDSKVGEAHD